MMDDWWEEAMMMDYYYWSCSDVVAWASTVDDVRLCRWLYIYILGIAF